MNPKIYFLKSLLYMPVYMLGGRDNDKKKSSLSNQDIPHSFWNVKETSKMWDVHSSRSFPSLCCKLDNKPHTLGKGMNPIILPPAMGNSALVR